MPKGHARPRESLRNTAGNPVFRARGVIARQPLRRDWARGGGGEAGARRRWASAGRFWPWGPLSLDLLSVFRHRTRRKRTTAMQLATTAIAIEPLALAGAN
jgi:hypothetical protein